MNGEESSLPLVIDLELIKRLKAEGKHSQVKNLLDAFRKNCASNFKEEKKEIFSKDRKIRVNAGMCIQLSCKNEREINRSHCAKCLEMKNIHKIKNKR